MIKRIKQYFAVGAMISLAAGAMLVAEPALAYTPNTHDTSVKASASWLKKDPVAVAKEADEAGYIVVPASDSFPYEGGTMYPTGPISEDTLVVIQNPDGSLPGGLTKSSLEAHVAAVRSGQVVASKTEGQATPMTSMIWNPSAGGGWGSAVNVGSLIGWDAGARAGYSYSTYANTAASGNGLGYEYKCTSSTYCGQVSAYYFVGFADQSNNYWSQGSAPWGHVAANRMFMGRCTQTIVCGGTAQ